ncbi:winged helix-turn-helix domain-containing protein [uncultured Parolsenella sp.]|uniref:winged helix-turn-helix domain-containing protein n=1 Tax=uncultured Parolsenella sp. TaxID=2083008 RepID=UPI0034507058
MAKKDEECVLGLLRSNGEMSVRELVSEIGLSVSQVRYRRNALISAGVIEPTVGATSRLRRQLVRGQRGLVASREGGHRGQVRETGAVGTVAPIRFRWQVANGSEIIFTSVSACIMEANRVTL